MHSHADCQREISELQALAWSYSRCSLIDQALQGPEDQKVVVPSSSILTILLLLRVADGTYNGAQKPACANCQRQSEACGYSIRLNWKIDHHEGLVFDQDHSLLLENLENLVSSGSTDQLGHITPSTDTEGTG